MNDLFSVPSDQVIVSSRFLNAAPELVFRVFEEPERLKRWWGPEGFTNTFHEFDFREGGKWTYTMHGPEKGNYENACEFIRIEKPSLITWKRFSKPLFKMMLTIEELADGGTKFSFHQIFETREECEKLRPYVIDKNEENFDRLERELKLLKEIS